MNRSRLILASTLMCSLLCACSATAQAGSGDKPGALPPTQSEPVPAPANTAEHEALRGLRAAMEDALNKRDLDALLTNVDDNVVFTTMNGDVARGKEGIRKYFTRMMEGPDKVVTSITAHFVPDALSVFYGPDVAVAVGKTNDHYVLTSGRELDIHARWTATLVKKEGRWLVGAFHYSTNVFKNPVLDLQRKYLVMAGVGGGLLLGVLGFIIGRRKGRRTG